MSILLFGHRSVYTDRAAITHITDDGWALRGSPVTYEERTKIFHPKHNRYSLVKLGVSLQYQSEIDLLFDVLDWVISPLQWSGIKSSDDTFFNLVRKYTKRFNKELIEIQKKKGILDDVSFMTAEGFYVVTFKITDKALAIKLNKKPEDEYYLDGSMTLLVCDLLQCGYSPAEAVDLGTQYHNFSYPYGHDKVEFSDHVKIP